MIGRYEMRDVMAAVAVVTPVVNEVSDNGVITALELENYAMLGMTWGAWFKVGMFIALLLLIVERILNIRNKGRSSNATTNDSSK